MFGIGRLIVDGTELNDVPLCFNFRSGELGYQLSGKRAHSREDICFGKLAIIHGRFASPWGYFDLKPTAQWTSHSTGGGKWGVHKTSLHDFLEDGTAWQYSWLKSNQKITFEAPYSYEETLFVGRSLDLCGPVDLDDSITVVSRKSSVSLIGSVSIDDVYPLYCGAVSVAAGAVLRAHSHHTASTLTIFPNRYEPLDKSAHPLFYAGYPLADLSRERPGYLSVLSCALAKFGSAQTGCGPGLIEVLQYMGARSSTADVESRILTGFAFLETFCEKHLKKRDYPCLFGVSDCEAEALNRYRNDLIHNNLNPVQATGEFAKRISNCSSKRYHAIREDVRDAESIMSLVYVLSICDQQLLRWIEFDGLTQMYIPTKDDALCLWQPNV